MTLSHLKVTFAVWSLSKSHTAVSIARISYDVYTRESEYERGLLL